MTMHLDFPDKLIFHNFPGPGNFAKHHSLTFRGRGNPAVRSQPPRPTQPPILAGDGQ